MVVVVVIGVFVPFPVKLGAQPDEGLCLSENLDLLFVRPRGEVFLDGRLVRSDPIKDGVIPARRRRPGAGRSAASTGAAAPRSRCGAWPAPAITADCAALPYCDNLTVYGVNADQVGAGIERMINAFSNLGFDLHEISGVEEVSSPLFLDQAH